ncbi:MAG: 3-methyladenine DNA glycosylase, partial [Aliifodinibius sp.]|nr:3-methyladenine DNA glycosylase [candidate division Zixibacteria bacterium]NIT58155.1 3-methyladenine DNA glycosylase [Fodinibius sp.]NIW39383.1 3-methyladenine DNA glycosylase [candidate division Zixibacteria bacterium]NIX56934.1 3-methyladenine DNA glycosylase [candidate division Zixibacteria bacterium]NIY26737.1 3-methyladenine DNA glycosylase [Fodinibius sp.]
MEPLEGLEVMHKNRDTDVIMNLTNGPGKLCNAFGLTTAHSGIDMTKNVIFLEDDGYKPGKIIRTERIGIKNGRDKKWRFLIDGNKFVSKR